MPRSGTLRVALLAALVVTAGCAGPSAATKRGLNENLAARNWAAAEAALDAKKEREYGEKNAVLYWLDKAAVLHYAGKYAESDALLDQAELRIDELYTRSVRKVAGTFVLNDNTEPYAGEPHERALLHVLRAMNHVFMGRPEGGLVEARKVSAYLVELHDRLEGKLVYRDDAFAHYLAALLFEDAGRADDARISLALSREAYQWYAADYGVDDPTDAPPIEAPRVVDVDAAAASDAPLDDDCGEVVLVHYNGRGPSRGSRTIQVAWNDAFAALNATGEHEANPQVKNAVVAGLVGNAVTVAFPVFVQEPYDVKGSRVGVAGARAETLLVEDVSAISKKALDDKIALIWVRALSRATVKTLLARLAEEQARRAGGSGFGLLAGLATRVVAAATEVADTRAWTTIPAQIRMARLRVPPGRHDVTVEYLSASGERLGSEVLPAVEVATGRRTWLAVRTAD